MDDLRQQLGAILAKGLANEPIAHARQVAGVASILQRAFEAVGLRSTLVGGSAIEVHAPGIYKSGDIDLVVEGRHTANPTDHIRETFERLGFERSGRHWRLGDLFVEVPGRDLTDPAEVVRVGTFVFRVIRKEVLLADRIVGFKHWKYTAYGQQAIDMLVAFGDDLDMRWFRERLEREAATDAYHELLALARGEVPVTETVLEALLDRLHRRVPREET